MNVREYFEARFPNVCYDERSQLEALESTPLDSVCGLDCKIAIDAAGLVEDAIAKAHGSEANPPSYAHPCAAEHRRNLEAITLDVILVYICG